MIRVLIVDDHAIVRSGLAQLLATADDLELVGEAADGARGGRGWRPSLRPDVVLMDLSMPGTDGVAGDRADAGGRPGTHVLVLTSFSDQQLDPDALEAGPRATCSSTASPR